MQPNFLGDDGERRPLWDLLAPILEERIPQRAALWLTAFCHYVAHGLVLSAVASYAAGDGRVGGAPSSQSSPPTASTIFTLLPALMAIKIVPARLIDWCYNRPTMLDVFRLQLTAFDMLMWISFACGLGATYLPSDTDAFRPFASHVLTVLMVVTAAMDAYVDATLVDDDWNGFLQVAGVVVGRRLALFTGVQGGYNVLTTFMLLLCGAAAALRAQWSPGRLLQVERDMQRKAAAIASESRKEQEDRQNGAQEQASTWWWSPLAIVPRVGPLLWLGLAWTAFPQTTYQLQLTPQYRAGPIAERDDDMFPEATLCGVIVLAAVVTSRRFRGHAPSVLVACYGVMAVMSSYRYLLNADVPRYFFWCNVAYAGIEAVEMAAYARVARLLFPRWPAVSVAVLSACWDILEIGWPIALFGAPRVQFAMQLTGFVFVVMVWHAGLLPVVLALEDSPRELWWRAPTSRAAAASPLPISAAQTRAASRIAKIAAVVASSLIAAAQMSSFWG